MRFYNIIMNLLKYIMFAVQKEFTKSMPSADLTVIGQCLDDDL